jgi:YegS/Rv2252/BmrU family lipid kinase
VRRALAIVNPGTGRRSPDAVATALSVAAHDRGVDLTVEFTKRPGDAVDLVRSCAPDVELLIAVGGDGTVSDVVTGAIDGQYTIGIIPTGSTNMIAKDLGIPSRLDRAASIALGDGVPIDIDVARAGNTTVLHMAGAGYDAAIMRDASPRWKRRVGWLAYLPPGIRHLRYPRFTLAITADDRELEIPARVVLCAIGSSIIAPRFKIGAGISRTDGIVDVCVFDPPGVLATLSCMVWIGLGRPERSRWLRQLRGKRIHLDADRTVPFEVDGDPVGNLPVTIEVLDRRITVLVPPPHRRR